MAKVQFRCSIAPISSALKFGGDTGRVTLEVPKSDIEQAVALIALQGVPLRVTFEMDDEACKTGLKQGYADKQNNVQTRHERKSKRTSAKKPSTD